MKRGRLIILLVEVPVRVAGHAGTRLKNPFAKGELTMLTFLHVEDNEDDANCFAIAVQYACREVRVRRVSPLSPNALKAA